MEISGFSDSSPIMVLLTDAILHQLSSRIFIFHRVSDTTGGARFFPSTVS